MQRIAPTEGIGPAECSMIACRACGATTDLVTEVRYVGGRGLVEVVACRDLPACWERCDAQAVAAVCYALGLRHSDDPDCVHPIVRAYKIRVNDARWSSDQARARGLRRAAVAQLGSLGIDRKVWLGYAVEQVTRRVVPMAIAAVVPLFPDRSAALEAAAERCRSEGTQASAYAARNLLRKVRDAAADAAADAAYAAYAAYAAAYAAYAAAYAAYAAAYAAYAAYAAGAAGAAGARKPSGLLALVPTPDAILAEAAEICVEACVLCGTEGSAFLDAFVPKETAGVSS